MLLARRVIAPSRSPVKLRESEVGAIWAASERQLGKRAQRAHVRRADEQGRDARLAPGVEPVADALARADERDLVDQRVGNGGHRLTLFPVEVERLDALRVVLVAVPPNKGGPRERIRDRLDAWRESGVTTLLVGTPDVNALRTLAELVL